jgi:predicted nucleic acid-binding protein
MIGYVDSSVVIRLTFGQPNPVAEWEQLERGVASELLRVECLRTIDRARSEFGFSDEEVARRRGAVLRVVDDLDVVEISPPVLERARQPFPTALGTLDAIHLSSALLWQQSEGRALSFLTHDRQLGIAARAMGLVVLGSS